MQERAAFSFFAVSCLLLGLVACPAVAEARKYGLGTLTTTGSLKLVRPGGDDGRSSIFRKPGSLASLREQQYDQPTEKAPPASADFAWFWTEAMPAAASDHDGVSVGLVRHIIDRRSRGLPTYGDINVGADIYMRYRDEIDKAAAETGLSQAVITSVIAIESAGVATATSPKGAMGLMQLMPATAERFGVKSAYSPLENVAGGARYLAELLKLHHGDFVLALASYNAGEGTVDKHDGVPPYRETRDYVAKFFSIYAATKSVCKNEPVDPAALCERQA